MAYQALYRVYRSQTFADVIGQKAVTQTLKNAIIHQQISHAYLFTGPRGTGKTSCAKIFAKAVNCLHPHEGEPCNECAICTAINEGRLNDVIEIDAASNNGVEEIREIRDKVNYAPTEAKYKVYIIDEVHMLSKGAFNALLKTLEEPPANVIFILATTEPHKIPATIVSRTQRFDFKRIRDNEIVQHMATILADLDVQADEGALEVIAKAAEGGMRDALSILDQAIAFADDKLITIKDAMDVTGSLTYEMMNRYLLACSEGDTQLALAELESILNAGKESYRFVEDMLMYCRDLLLYQQAPAMVESQRLGEEFVQLAERIEIQQIYHFIDLLTKTQQDLKLSLRSDVYLEVLTVKLAQPIQEQAVLPSDESTMTELKQEIQQLKKELLDLKQGSTVKATQTAIVSHNERPVSASFKMNKDKIQYMMKVAKREYLDELQEAWDEITNQLSNQQVGLVNSAHPVAASQEGYVLSFDYAILAQKAREDEALLRDLQQASERILQRSIEVEYIAEDDWQTLRNEFIQAMKKKSVTPTEKKTDPLIEQAKSLFGDRVEIVDD